MKKRANGCFAGYVGVAFFLLSVGVVRAVDGVWTNETVSADQSWTVPGNWTDASGGPLGDYPKAAGDTATFLPPPGFALQKIHTGGRNELVLDSVSGGPQQTIVFGNDKPLSYVSQNYYYDTADARLTLSNPSGFTGYWANNIGRSVFTLAATAATRPTLHALSFAGFPGVEVPDAGTAATVGSVYEPGAMVKSGNGELLVETLETGNDTIYVKKGALVFRGDDDAEAERIIAGAAVRFDASRTDTLTVQTGADGRREVVLWGDANGGGHHAFPSPYPGSDEFISYTRSPFVGAARSPTGLPLVDFGARLPGDVAELGPTNCNLRFSSRLSGVREIFCAADYPKSMYCCVAVGDTETYHLCPSDGLVHVGGGDRKYFTVTRGDLALNGVKVENADVDPAQVSGMTVHSVASLDGIRVALLGSGCYRTEYNGGVRLGEAIVFTNTLTRAERMKINRYLMRKWQGAPSARVAANVFLESAGTPVGVAAGGVARVGGLVAQGGTVTKTGEGVLAVGSVAPASADIVVQGGSVRFDSVSAPVKKVADSPYIWLDAKKIAADGVRTFDGNPTNYLASWKDCRDGVETAATGVYETAPRMPYVVADAAGPGLPAVGFGLQERGDHSHLRFPVWTSGGSVRAGFAVLRPLSATVKISPFGSSMLATIREAGRIAHRNCVQPNLVTARWAVDGVAVDPLASLPELSSTNDFFLLSFTSDRNINIGGIAGQRTGAEGPYSNDCGGWEIAEMIIYQHALTEDERRGTEAYLLDKWLGRPHPVTARRVGNMTYGDAAGRVIDADADVTVGKVTVPSGVFVKRGDGTVSLDALTGADGISVEGGTLSVALPVKALDAFGPHVHFDAADVSSLEFSVTENGSVTNVTRWRSSVGSLTADSEATYYGKTVCGGIVDPTLTAAETADGLTRPTVSFGRRGTAADPASDAAAMRFSVGASGLLEVHEIVADASAGKNRQALFDNFNKMLFLRGKDGALFDTVNGYVPPAVLEGYIAVDGEPAAPGDVLPDGFHLVSIAPTGAVTTTGFANDRFASMGGIAVSEYIGFRRTLTADERDYVQRFLQAKWLGGPAPAWPTAFGSLAAASGATLAFTGASAVAVASVSGGGTISAGAIKGVGAVSVRYTDAATWETLTLAGDVSFADTVVVTVTADDPADVAEGVYPIVSLPNASGIDIAALELELVNFPAAGKTVTAAAVGNKIVLRVYAPGFVLTVR